jgi:hypothetical protein
MFTDELPWRSGMDRGLVMRHGMRDWLGWR